MKTIDRILQRWRIGKAAPYIAPGARVLDIGCSEGELFEHFAARIGVGVGIDDDLEAPRRGENFELLPGRFPEALGDVDPFDVITMTAVLEHVPTEQQSVLAEACSRHLKTGGHLVITTPGPIVDHILDAMKFLRLIDGMGLEEHFGFEPAETPAIFTPFGLDLIARRRFQLGLNHLFVFRKKAP